MARWLLAHLESQGDQVVGLDAEVDVTDEPALVDAITGAAPDAICHLAAQASVGSSWKDQSATYAVNTFGALNVLDRRPGLQPAAPGAADQLGRGLRAGRQPTSFRSARISRSLR